MNVRANVDANVTKRLKVGVNFSFEDVHERQVQADGRYINDGIVQSALLMFPQFPVYNEDGSFAVGNQIAMKADGYQMVENPVALAYEIDARYKLYRMNFNTNITYDILKIFNLRLILVPNIIQTDITTTDQAQSDKMVICRILKVLNQE